MTRQRCLLLFTLIKYRAGSSRQCNKARKGKKGVQTRNEELKPSLLVDDMIVYTENPKESSKRLLELSEFNRVTGYEMNIQNSIVFLYTRNEYMTQN